jgi:hypothetical protein
MDETESEMATEQLRDYSSLYRAAGIQAEPIFYPQTAQA